MTNKSYLFLVILKKFSIGIKRTQENFRGNREFRSLFTNRVNIYIMIVYYEKNENVHNPGIKKLHQFEIPATNCYKCINLTFLVENRHSQFLMTMPKPIFERQFRLSNRETHS